MSASNRDINIPFPSFVEDHSPLSSSLPGDIFQFEYDEPKPPISSIARHTIVSSTIEPPALTKGTLVSIKTKNFDDEPCYAPIMMNSIFNHIRMNSPMPLSPHSPKSNISTSSPRPSSQNNSSRPVSGLSILFGHSPMPMDEKNAAVGFIPVPMSPVPNNAQGNNPYASSFYASYHSQSSMDEKNAAVGFVPVHVSPVPNNAQGNNPYASSFYASYHSQSSLDIQNEKIEPSEACGDILEWDDIEFVKQQKDNFLTRQDDDFGSLQSSPTFEKWSMFVVEDKKEPLFENNQVGSVQSDDLIFYGSYPFHQQPKV